MKLFALGGLLFLLLRPLAAIAQDEWFYADILDSRGRQVILSSDYPGGHRGGSMKACTEDTAFLCLEAPGFQFAYPRRRTSETSWTLNGVAYTVAREEERVFLGQSLRLVFIDQTMKGVLNMRFVFSEERGLLALSAVNDQPTPVFLLQNYCGFGAPARCKENEHSERRR